MPFTLKQAMLCVRYISCLTTDTNATQRRQIHHASLLLTLQHFQVDVAEAQDAPAMQYSNMQLRHAIHTPASHAVCEIYQLPHDRYR
jgi:hypothetical protein